jgi:hypothetical protein
MKKIILMIVIMIKCSVSFTQTKQQLVDFIYDRTMPFNKNSKIIEVNNLDSVMKSMSRKNISFCHDIFKIYGTSFSPAIVVGGYSQTIIKSKKVPFIMYKTYKINGNTVIELVNGSNSL